MPKCPASGAPAAGTGRAALVDGVEPLIRARIQQGGVSDAACAAQARARIFDLLAQVVGALVLSRACPDDSPLADELLVVSRGAILASLQPPRVN